MDIFNHGLWSYIAFNKKPKKESFTAVAFGVLPDLIPFTPVTLYMLFHRITFDPSIYNGATAWVYRFAYEAYNYTHSLVIFAVVFLLVYAIRRKPLWPMLAWGLHVLMDIPTHPDFFRTPFLYPISDYRLPWGISWANPIFMVVNYGVVILCFVLIYAYRKKRKTS
jgi:membrane-bound metal-dependent hydrolase YbcI (DUF457 family)